MKISKEKCRVWLLVTSVTLLSVNFFGISADSMIINVLFFEVSGIKSSNALALPLLMLAIVLIPLIGHIWLSISEIANKYTEGYQDNSSFKKLIKEGIVSAAETDRYGAPRIGTRASLYRKSFVLGQWKKPNGALSEVVIISPDKHVHRQALLSGIACVFGKGLWVRIYIPIIIGVLALISVIGGFGSELFND